MPALQQEGIARTFPPPGIPWRTLSAVGVVTAIGWVVPFAVGALGATLATELRTSASGVGLAVAGAILAGLSVTAVASRIGTGLLLAGDATRLFRLAAALVLGGGVGYATMATGSSLAFVAGAALVFAVGWAFLGVVLGATLVAAKDPGASMSRVQVGLFAGPALAPLIYGPVFADSADRSRSLIMHLNNTKDEPWMLDSSDSAQWASEWPHAWPRPAMT